ncbi:MAG: transferase [Muribaculaceae bacterium]|nr:transferase [Muribaculaceae bacterium]
MIFSIPLPEIVNLLCRQVDNLFTLTQEEREIIQSLVGKVLNKIEYCFSLTENKYYSRDGQTFFNPFQSAQYTIFLYFFSRIVHEQTAQSILADKLYYLNKALNGCDMFYEVKLPAFFKLDHPVGSVMGRAEYGEGFSFGQCCTVGNNRGIYPVIGKNVRMCAFSSIIGNCKVGNNVIIGANSGIKDLDVPDNTVVFGQYPNNIFKPIESR